MLSMLEDRPFLLQLKSLRNPSTLARFDPRPLIRESRLPKLWTDPVGADFSLTRVRRQMSIEKPPSQGWPPPAVFHQGVPEC